MRKLNEDLEALSWCYTVERGDNAPLITFRAVVKNSGRREISGPGKLTLSLVVDSSWLRVMNPVAFEATFIGSWQDPGFAQFVKTVNVPQQFRLPPGQVATYPDGLRFSYESFQGKNASKLAFHRLFSYSFDLASDQQPENNNFWVGLTDFQNVVTGELLVELANEYDCDDVPVDLPEHASQDNSFANMLLPPGLVVGLWHDLNVRDPVNPGDPAILPKSRAALYLKRCFGGDIKAPFGRGYRWWMVHDYSIGRPNDWTGKLPSGLVLALRHSQNQSTNSEITLFGQDATKQYSYQVFGIFQRAHGGDLGAPRDVGFYWYETTDLSFNDWQNAEDRLPQGTVFGLKHSSNQPSKTFRWRNDFYDPVSEDPPPPGFVRRHGGDLGGPSGVGFYWFEKVTGPELFSFP